jgi:hypothetical protein
LPGSLWGADRHRRARVGEPYLDHPTGPAMATHAAVVLLQGLAHEVWPVGGEVETVLGVVGEAELLGVDAIVGQRRDHVAGEIARLHHADHLVGYKGIGRPAGDEIVGMDLPEPNRRRPRVGRRILDAAGGLGDHELDVDGSAGAVSLDPPIPMVSGADSSWVNHEHLVDPAAIRPPSAYEVQISLKRLPGRRP